VFLVDCVMSFSLRVLTFIVLALSLAVMPSLVVGKGEKRFEILTDKSTYHVGESLMSVSWDVADKAANCMLGGATGILVITGSKTQASATLNQNQLGVGSFKGSFEPAVGRPWQAVDAGDWQAVLNVKNSNGCNAMGSYDFQVVNP